MEAIVASVENTVPPVLDENRLSVLKDIEGDDGRPFIHEFVELFESDAVSRLQALRSAVTAGEQEGLRKMAHTLKGSCRNVGAVAMAEACLRLENGAESCSSAEAAHMVDRIAEEYDRVKDRIAEAL